MWRKRYGAIDEATRVITDVERSRERTMNRAVKLLAAKPRSVRELRERLLEKLWTNDEIVDRVIEKLKEYRSAVISAAVTGKIDVRGEAA